MSSLDRWCGATEGISACSSHQRGREGKEISCIRTTWRPQSSGSRCVPSCFGMVHDSVRFPGRVADQKRIRKLIRLLAIPSPGHVAVWEECFFRWRSLGEMAARQSFDPSDGTLPVGDRSLSTEVLNIYDNIDVGAHTIHRNDKLNGTILRCSWPASVHVA